MSVSSSRSFFFGLLVPDGSRHIDLLFAIVFMDWAAASTAAGARYHTTQSQSRIRYFLVRRAAGRTSPAGCRANKPGGAVNKDGTPKARTRPILSRPSSQGIMKDYSDE